MSVFPVAATRTNGRAGKAGTPAALAADRARASGRAWAARPLGERAGVLKTAASLMADEADALASALTAPGRRTAAEVWSGEIIPTLDALRWLARDGVSALRPVKLSRARLQWYFRSARHELILEPHGVIGIVTPSNALLFLAVPQVAAALLAGNGVVWKPAPAGAGVAARVARIFDRAGLPPGTLLVFDGGAEAARDLVIAGVDKLHFTGGTAAGLDLYRLHAAHGRPAVLELSGRHIAVVLDDADPRVTARGVVWGKLASGGRHCISIQLVLATRGIAGRLVEALRDAMAATPPLTLEPEEEVRLAALVGDAVAGGARLVHAAPWPALVTDAAPGMRVVDEEVQGPILAVATVESDLHATAWVNASTHRLSASIWTGSPARGRELARRLDAGQVWINDALHPAAHPAVTLAGRGRSGFGASRGVAGLMEMVQPKVISEMPLGAGHRHHAGGEPETADLFRATARLGLGRDPGQRLRALVSLARALVRAARRP